MTKFDRKIEKLINHYNRVNAGYDQTYAVDVIFGSGSLESFFFNSKQQAAAFFAGAMFGLRQADEITYIVPGVHCIDDLGGRE